VLAVLDEPKEGLFEVGSFRQAVQHHAVRRRELSHPLGWPRAVASFLIVSVRGRGTTLRAELPCVS